MKSYNLLQFTCLLIPIVTFCQIQKRDTIKVFYLGGQSNMDGYGYNSHLPDSLNQEFNDVFIFHGNSAPDGNTDGGLGIWEILKPGHGTNFSSTSNKAMLSDRFGIELSFAKKLQRLYPNEKIALIKYSRGGTSIDSLAATQFGSWEPDYNGNTGINQYDHFLNTVKSALSIADIDGDGQKDVLVPYGIIWMQGEADASHTEHIANNYYHNLKRLMDLMRASFLKDDLPVVIGKISDSWNDKDGKVWDYGDLVEYAQEKYAKNDKKAAIIRNTRYYKYSDPWHYDSQGYIDLGEKFAEAIFKLNNN